MARMKFLLSTGLIIASDNTTEAVAKGNLDIVERSWPKSRLLLLSTDDGEVTLVKDHIVSFWMEK